MLANIEEANLEFVGSADVYFPDSGDFWKLNANPFYHFHLAENPSVLPYLGGELNVATAGNGESNTEAGVNLGGGLRLPLDNVSPFVEARAVISDYDQAVITFGLVFAVGGFFRVHEPIPGDFPVRSSPVRAADPGCEAARLVQSSGSSRMFRRSCIPGAGGSIMEARLMNLSSFERDRWIGSTMADRQRREEAAMTSFKTAGVGLTGAFVLSVAATSPGTRTGDGACQVRYTPDELTLSPRPVRILAETEGGTPGELERVRPDRESGIEVLEAERDRNVPDPTWILQLDISDAAPGSWTIELSGEREDCTGRLELREL